MKKALKNKQLIRKEKHSSFLACSFTSVATITKVIELHSIWQVETKHIQKKVKNINLLLLLIILLCTPSPLANKAYLRKNFKNTICPDWTERQVLQNVLKTNIY